MATVPSPYADYPPRWAVFDGHVPMFDAGMMGFSGSTGDVNRFAARYRAARCFRCVEFEGLTNDTADGYSMLCLLLLTYSAFEYFLKAIGIEQRNTSTLLDDDERDRVIAHVRGLNGSTALFTFVRRFLNESYQRQIDSFTANRACNPVYLAGALRHAFAHGMLTATPATVPSQTVATVCRFLCRVLVRIMDREFVNRMDQFEKDFEEWVSGHGN